MQLNREGRFRAKVLEIGISESGDNKLATVAVRFGIEEEIQNG